MSFRKNPISLAYTFVVTSVTFGVLLYAQDHAVLEKIEAFSSDRLALAWLLMLAFSVFCAFIPFLPSVFFYAMCGRIFRGHVIPFLVSLSFITLLHALSYLIGTLEARFFLRPTARFNQTRPVFFQAYRKFKERLYRRTSHAISCGRLKTLLVFSLSPFPEKAFGRICGRSGVLFPAYLFCAVLGSLPSLISVTLLGKSVSDPSSPLFYISLSLTVTVSVISLLIYKNSRPKEITHEKSY